MKYSIGLDIGISSVGYSVLGLDVIDMPDSIIRVGSRVFDKAETEKGASLALTRRTARSARRRLRRHRHRIERIYGLIVSSDILDKSGLETLFDGKLTDVYALRVRALDERVSPQEFARILINLAQRRGFQSNRKKAKVSGKEDGKLLLAVSENEKLCREKGYRTIGEMFLKDEKFSEYKRNKGENYICTVGRSAVEAEARLIFAAQRKTGAVYATEQVEEEYINILISQRSFADGPACGPYSGNQVMKMRGYCTFEKDCMRAAKASYSFQLFNLWQRINNVRLNEKGGVVALSAEQREKLFKLAHEKADLDYTQLRKSLELADDVDFCSIRYKEGERKNAEKKTKFKCMESYHVIRKSISPQTLAALSHDQLDAIGEAFSKNMAEDAIVAELKQANIADEMMEELLQIPDFSKFGHLSVKACKKLLPFLAEGKTYDKACDAAGYGFKTEGTGQKKYLPPIPADDTSITNPVVRRALSQSIKVINAIIREMGESPVYINIELARELSNDLNERLKIRKAQDENEANNARLMDELKALSNGSNPKGQDLVKYKLWKEQDGRCLYSGKEIKLERLCEIGYVDVDHIVPYSVSFDDRMLNKALVLASENRQKGNRLPLQYLTDEKKERFIVTVNQSHLGRAKKSRLLMEKMPDDEWKQRNIQDTQYISRFLHKYISDNLLFAPTESGKKRRVYTVSGTITGYVRKRWGVHKNRHNGDLHHAEDALVIACITPGMINMLSKYHVGKETVLSGKLLIDKQTGEVLASFPLPWPSFIEDKREFFKKGEAHLNSLIDQNFESISGRDAESKKLPFVSRMSNHKITGAAHKDTVRSGRLRAEEKVVSKVPLAKLKLDKDGEIENYYMPESDKLLYNALKARLLQFGGKGEKAFEDLQFRKPKADGTPGPIVNKVKVVETASGGVLVQNKTGVADNESMIRCDVFFVEGDGYYFVPVYVSDSVKKQLPNLAPMQGKDKDGRKRWKEMRDEDFLFSLYNNDLIGIVSKGSIPLSVRDKKSTLKEKFSFPAGKELMLYYKGLDVAVAMLKGITHDSTYENRSIGKTMKKIEKYEVDVLGNVKRVGRERRREFL